MFRISLPDIKQFISLTFNYIDKDKLNVLFKRYNNDAEELSPAVVYEMMLKSNSFAADYSKLANEVLNNDYFIADLADRRLRFYDTPIVNTDNNVEGEVSYLNIALSNAVTPEAEKKNVLDWLNGVGDFLQKGVASVTSIWDRISGLADKQADTANKEAQAKANMTNGLSTGAIIGIVVGCIVFLTVIILIARK